MTHSKIACLLSSLALLPATAALAEDPISAERPSFSSSPLALGEDRWQLEGGFQYFRADSNVDGYNLPQLLLRRGTSENIELQIAWAGYTKVDVDGAGSVSGTGDASVGIKWQLADDDATTPIALFAGLSLPIGESGFTSDEVDPTVGLFWAHNVGPGWFGTVSVSESDSTTVLGNGIGVNVPTGSLCNNCGAYIEYFGIHAEGSGPAHNLNGGISWLLSNDQVVDVNIGIGLNDRAGDGYIGFGGAWRF